MYKHVDLQNTLKVGIPFLAYETTIFVKIESNWKMYARKAKLSSKENTFMNGLMNSLKTDEIDEVKNKLQTLKKEFNYKHMLKFYRTDDDESILHTAIIYQDKDIVSKLIDMYPLLMTFQRQNSDDYRGQTALHIAISRSMVETVETILENANTVRIVKDQPLMPDLLKIDAIGDKFVNTIMMGGLPLSVAALSLDINIVDVLLSHGADYTLRNKKKGDTVFHSLIRYAAIFPEKIQQIKEMFHHLQRHLEKKSPKLKNAGKIVYSKQMCYVWFLENNKNVTPLQLSAKLGVVELVEYILNIPDVYCFVSKSDGLFDIKLYDITDIDTITHHSNKKPQSKGHSNKKPQSEVPQPASILEMMFDDRLDINSVFQISNLTPIKNVINAKWLYYRPLFIAYMVIHFIILIALTAYSVWRIESYEETKSSEADTNEQIVLVLSLFMLILGIGYLLIVMLLLFAKFERRKYLPLLHYKWHYLQNILILLFFSLCLIADSIISFVGRSDNVALIFALIIGWWFNIFFLSPFRYFSFFTEMIRRIVIGDLLRFAVIIAFELISFSASLYIMFIGKTVIADDGMIVKDSNFNGFFATLLTLFKLMIGLTDIEAIYDAKVPGLAIALFITFIVFTYILMINSLIAMMSKTCSLVSEDIYHQSRIQKLSAVLFVEDTLIIARCRNMDKACIWKKIDMTFFNIDVHNHETRKRYFINLHSLLTIYATQEDRDAIRRNRQSVPSIVNTNPKKFRKRKIQPID